MGNVKLVIENLNTLPTSAANAATEASASMVAENMLNESPSKFWRSIGIEPSDTYLQFSPGSSDLNTVRANCLGIVGHNLSRGAQARVILENTTALFNPNALQRLPNTLISQTNSQLGSGGATAVTAIDEGYSQNDFASSADYVTSVLNNTPWTIRVAFQDPGGTIRTGSNRQVFWAYVRPSTAPTSASNAPTVKCELFETGGGTALADLGTKVIVGSATGRWVFWSWDASLLADGTGDSVECQLTFSGNTSSHYSGQLDSLVWQYVFDDETSSISSVIYDSGWVEFPELASFGVTYFPSAKGAGSAWLIEFGNFYTFSTASLFIRCDTAPTSFTYGEEVPAVPPGYYQIGTVVIGEAWTPTVNMSYGKMVAGIDTSPKKRTYGGQLFGSRRPVRRVVSLQLGHLTPAECHTLFDRLIWRHGVMKPILISLLPDDATQSKHTTIFGALRNPENWVNIQPDEGYENNMSLEFEEVL